MDLDKTIETLKKDLEIFGLNHRCSKLELYRKYQQYLKKEFPHAKSKQSQGQPV